MSIWMDWQVEIDQDTREKPSRRMEEAVGATLREEAVETPVEVSISVVSPEQIQETNRTFRQIDTVTDVLSFPLIAYEGRTPAQGVAEGDWDPDTEEVCLGDIMICLQRAQEQAAEFGHTLEREMGFLTVHSMLHLLGYDHMTPEEEQSMVDKQKKILEGMGLPR